jgi:hypothetical protein
MFFLMGSEIFCKCKSLSYHRLDLLIEERLWLFALLLITPSELEVRSSRGCWWEAVAVGRVARSRRDEFAEKIRLDYSFRAFLSRPREREESVVPESWNAGKWLSRGW